MYGVETADSLPWYFHQDRSRRFWPHQSSAVSVIGTPVLSRFSRLPIKDKLLVYESPAARSVLGAMAGTMGQEGDEAICIRERWWISQKPFREGIALDIPALENPIQPIDHGPLILVCLIAYWHTPPPQTRRRLLASCSRRIIST